MKRAASILCVCLLTVGAFDASAEVLAKWNLDGLSRSSETGVQANPKTVAEGLTVSPLTFSPTFTATAWFDALTVYANSLAKNLSGAISKQSYFSFTVTPGSGQKVSFDRIFSRVSVNTGDLSQGAVIKLVLLSSVDGFDSNRALGSFTAAHPTDDANATESTGVFDLSGAASLKNVSGPVEFRIYTVLESGVGNRFGFGHIFYEDGQDDLRVEGSVGN